jgi:hypothetical protein
VRGVRADAGVLRLRGAVLMRTRLRYRATLLALDVLLWLARRRVLGPLADLAYRGALEVLPVAMGLALELGGPVDMGRGNGGAPW